MREIAVEQFVAAKPHEVADALDPAAVVAYEESFDVFDVENRAGETLVTVGGRGLRMDLRFESTADGLHYEQVDDAGPLDEMWTELAWAPENEGTRVTARSGVTLGLPLAAVTDRVAAWKRRGELERALQNLAAEIE